MSGLRGVEINRGVRIATCAWISASAVQWKRSTKFSLSVAKPPKSGPAGFVSVCPALHVSFVLGHRRREA